MNARKTIMISICFVAVFLCFVCLCLHKWGKSYHVVRYRGIEYELHDWKAKVLYPSYDNEHPEKIEIPDQVYFHSVTGVDFRAFYKNDALQEVILGKNVMEIGVEAFAKCTSLRTVILNEGLVTIKAGAFEGCENLVTIDFPESLTDVGAFAFKGATNLREITGGESIISIGNTCFLDTAWYDAQEDAFVVFGSILLHYDGAEKEMYIPNGIAIVARDALENCGGMRIYVPQTVKYFMNSELKSKNDKVELIWTETGKREVFEGSIRNVSVE